MLGKYGYYSHHNLAQTGPFIILLCLTTDYFTHQGRTYEWERVNELGLPSPFIFLNALAPTPAYQVLIQTFHVGL